MRNQNFFVDGGGPGAVLDMGAGPSICNINAAGRWSSHIYLADLLEGNRKEIAKYLNSEEDTWNLEPYFDFQVHFISVIILFY